MQNTDEIIERMARALCADVEDSQDVYDDLSSRDKQNYRDMAKAALEASGLLNQENK